MPKPAAALLILAFATLCGACAAPKAKVTSSAPAGDLIFKNGFEGSTRVVASKVSEKDGNTQKENSVGSEPRSMFIGTTWRYG